MRNSKSVMICLGGFVMVVACNVSWAVSDCVYEISGKANGYISLGTPVIED